MMQWLTNRYLAEGKGIAKNAPQKTGLPLLAQTIWRESWSLFKLNLLLVLFSMPIVTLPLAHAAATQVTMSMARDENHYLWEDFWAAFRKFGLRASVLGFGAALVVGLGGTATYFYLQKALVSWVFVLPMVMAFCVTLFAILVACHLFPLLVTRETRVMNHVRLAALAALHRPLPVLGALGGIAGLWAVHIIFYPVSIFMPAVVNFSLGVLLISFSTRKGIDFVLEHFEHSQIGQAR